MKKSINIKKIFSILFITFLFFKGVSLEGKGIDLLSVEEAVYITNVATVTYNLSRSGISNEVKTKVFFSKLDKEKLILNEKVVDRKTVKIGQKFKYTLEVKNTTKEKIDYFVIEDIIPPGIFLENEKIQINSEFEVSLEKNEKGKFFLKVIPRKEFDLEDYPIIKISYYVKVGVNAKIGKNISKIKTRAYKEKKYYDSNESQVTVEITSDNFETKGTIFGRVYVDLNKNNLYDEKEPTIPGAKVILENGDYAITDKNGKYSIYGERAITHILKLDLSTIPMGADTIKLGNLHNNKGDSIFINLKSEEFHKGNFAFKDPTPIFLKQIEERRKIFEIIENEAISYIDNVELKFTSTNSWEKQLEESGVVGKRKNISFIDNLGLEPEEKKEILEIGNIPKIDNLNIAEYIEEFEDSLDFYNIKDGDSISALETIQIKGKNKGITSFYVNGEEISEEIIGFKSIYSKKEIFFQEYVAVKFRPGKNILKLIQKDPFGNEREKKEIVVRTSGEYKNFTLKILNEEEYITGQPVELLFSAFDSEGYKIRSKIAVKIEVKEGKWYSRGNFLETKDYVFTTDEEGEAKLFFIPPEGNKKITMLVSSNEIVKKHILEINMKKSNIFINGIVEARKDLKDMNFSDRESDFLYEDSLQEKRNSNRTAIFAKGNINENYYMKLSYDSDPEKKKFFGYKDPEEFYPIYGDESIRGYEAYSISKLYLKINREASFFQFGDFKTLDFEDSELNLSKYNRVLNGYLLNIEKDKFNGRVFYSESSNQLVVEELRGAGISGPYNLKNDEIVPASETISLIVYSKYNPNMVLEERILQAFEDYTIDYESGKIYFSFIINSVDYDFNPTFIKINYEIEEKLDSEKSPLYGGSLNYNLTENMSFGLNFVKDEKEFNEFQMFGTNYRFKFLNNDLKIELAETDNFDRGKGKATLISNLYQNEKIKAELNYYNSTENFFNVSNPLQEDIKAFQYKGEYEFNSKLKLKLDGLRLTDKKTGNKKNEFYAGAELTFYENIKTEIGLRTYRLNEKDVEIESEDTNFSTLGGKITWIPEKIKSLEAFLEYEQNIKMNDQNRVGLGTKYKMSEKTNFYLRQEFNKGINYEYAITPEETSNRTLFGLESKHDTLGSFFSEYRVKDSDEKSTPEISSGIKNDFKINENFDFYLSFERITDLSPRGEEQKNDATALAIGYIYKINEKSKLTGDFEFSFQEFDESLIRMGYAKNISDELSIIAKTKYEHKESKRTQSKNILGMSYRDSKEDRLNFIAKYEMSYLDDISEEKEKKYSHIFKIANNYQFSVDKILTTTFSANYISEKNENKNKYLSYYLGESFTYNITSKIDLGINAAILSDENFKNYRYSLGAEVGYQLPKNIWLSLGYNIIGFGDTEFYSVKESKKGPYIRFRMKLDENIFE